MTESESYLIDNVKDRVALDIEWHAKDGNLDRDLAAYRAFYDTGLIDAGRGMPDCPGSTVNAHGGARLASVTIDVEWYNLPR